MTFGRPVAIEIGDRRGEGLAGSWHERLAPQLFGCAVGLDLQGGDPAIESGAAAGMFGEYHHRLARPQKIAYCRIGCSRDWHRHTSARYRLRP